MKTEELKSAPFRTFYLNNDKTEILFSENHNGYSFPINLDYKNEVLFFEKESISFDKIKEIKISFCYNKVGFKNIPCYKLHVFLNNQHSNYKLYLGLFKYTENNEFVNNLPKFPKSSLKQYSDFKQYIENKKKKEEKLKEEVNIQYGRFHLIDLIIKKIIKK